MWVPTRFAARVAERNPWILRLAVVIAVLPGIPTAVVYAAAGWARMRLVTFLLLDLVGAVLMTALVAGWLPPRPASRRRCPDDRQIRINGELDDHYGCVARSRD